MGYTVTRSFYDDLRTYLEFNVNEKGAYKEDGGYLISLVRYNNSNGFKVINVPAFAYVLDSVIPQHVIKDLKALTGVKLVCTPNIPKFKAGTVLFVPLPLYAKNNPGVNLNEYSKDIYDKTLNYLQTNNLLQANTCLFCESDKYNTETGEKLELVVDSIYNVFAYIHSSCKEQVINDLKNEISENEKNYKALPLSIILAVIGGVIGFIPTLITMFTIGYYYGLLFALVPICAMFGYKFGKAPRNKIMVGTCIVVTFLVVTAFILFNVITTKLAIDIDPSLGTLNQYITSNLFTFLMLYVFGGLGIVISWNIITKSKKDDLDNM